MKKTTELKIRIAGRWLLTFTEWMIATIVITLIMVKYDMGLGWCLIMPVLLGLVVVSPLLIRNEEIINHYERILARKLKRR